MKMVNKNRVALAQFVLQFAILGSFFNTEALGSLKEMMNIRVQQLTAGGNGVNIVAVGQLVATLT